MLGTSADARPTRDDEAATGFGTHSWVRTLKNSARLKGAIIFIAPRIHDREPVSQATSVSVDHASFYRPSAYFGMYQIGDLDAGINRHEPSVYMNAALSKQRIVRSNP